MPSGKPLPHVHQTALPPSKSPQHPHVMAERVHGGRQACTPWAFAEGHACCTKHTQSPPPREGMLGKHPSSACGSPHDAPFAGHMSGGVHLAPTVLSDAQQVPWLMQVVPQPIWPEGQAAGRRASRVGWAFWHSAFAAQHACASQHRAVAAAPHPARLPPQPQLTARYTVCRANARGNALGPHGAVRCAARALADANTIAVDLARGAGCRHVANMQAKLNKWMTPTMCHIGQATTPAATKLGSQVTLHPVQPHRMLHRPGDRRTVFCIEDRTRCLPCSTG